MATSRVEAGGRPGGSGTEAKPTPAGASSVPPASATGADRNRTTMVLLICNLVLMPVIAWALTTYVLLPKLQASSGGSAAPATESAGKKDQAVSGKSVVPLGGKVLVNVAGTMGTRYLVASISLVGTAPDFRSRVERNDTQLRDAAAGVLAGKTIADLERAGARNLIRAELISSFNTVLGEGDVSEIYLTDFAIQ